MTAVDRRQREDPPVEVDRQFGEEFASEGMSRSARLKARSETFVDTRKQSISSENAVKWENYLQELLEYQTENLAAKNVNVRNAERECPPLPELIESLFGQIKEEILLELDACKERVLRRLAPKVTENPIQRTQKFLALAQTMPSLNSLPRSPRKDGAPVGSWEEIQLLMDQSTEILAERLKETKINQLATRLAQEIEEFLMNAMVQGQESCIPQKNCGDMTPYSVAQTPFAVFASPNDGKILLNQLEHDTELAGFQLDDDLSELSTGDEFFSLGLQNLQTRIPRDGGNAV
jgi:hypothetical protein